MFENITRNNPTSNRYQSGTCPAFDKVLEDQAKAPEALALTNTKTEQEALRILRAQSKVITDGDRTFYFSGMLELQRPEVLQISAKFNSEILIPVKISATGNSKSYIYESAAMEFLQSKRIVFDISSRQVSAETLNQISSFCSILHSLSQKRDGFVTGTVERVKREASLDKESPAASLLNLHAGNIEIIRKDLEDILFNAKTSEELLARSDRYDRLLGYGVTSSFQEFIDSQSLSKHEMSNLLDFVPAVVMQELGFHTSTKDMSDIERASALDKILRYDWNFIATATSLYTTAVGSRIIEGLAQADYHMAHTHPVLIPNRLVNTDAPLEKSINDYIVCFDRPSDTLIDTIRKNAPNFIKEIKDKVLERISELSVNIRSLDCIIEQLIVADFPRGLIEILKSKEGQSDSSQYDYLRMKVRTLEDEQSHNGRKYDRTDLPTLQRSLFSELNQQNVNFNCERYRCEQRLLGLESQAMKDPNSVKSDILLAAISGSCLERDGVLGESPADADFSLHRNKITGGGFASLIFSRAGTVLSVSEHPEPWCTTFRLTQDDSVSRSRFLDPRVGDKLNGNLDIIGDLRGGISGSERVSKEAGVLPHCLLKVDENTHALLLPLDSSNPNCIPAFSDFFMTNTNLLGLHSNQQINEMNIQAKIMEVEGEKCLIVSFPANVVLEEDFFPGLQFSDLDKHSPTFYISGILAQANRLNISDGIPSHDKINREITSRDILKKLKENCADISIEDLREIEANILSSNNLKNRLNTLYCAVANTLSKIAGRDASEYLEIIKKEVRKYHDDSEFSGTSSSLLKFH